MTAKTATIIMASFLSSLFGYGQKDKSQDSLGVYPPEEFVGIESKLKDGRPVVGTLNQAYKNYTRKNEFPWCLRLSIALNLDSCFENGLPKSTESAIAYKLEDELMTEIKNIATTHYIGHVFSDSFLDIYFYLDKPDKVHKYLQTQVNKVGLVRGFGYEINNDPNWATFNQFFP
jgi:hypothetical protein